MKVVIFSTCIVDLFFPNVGAAMVEVLERFGCETFMPVKQICCGQPTYNSGYVKATQKVFFVMRSMRCCQLTPITSSGQLVLA